LQTVDIVLGAYQAEGWCDVAISTIVAQDFKNWRLIIRDDGSTDSTISILRFWRNRFPSQIVILDEDQPQNLGITGNFSRLFAASNAPYVMIASWDDVWYPDKVSTALKGMNAAEQQWGKLCPVLVHTDWRIVDGNLHKISDSARKHFGLWPDRATSVGSLFLETQVWGCTAMANRSLIDLAGSIPREATVEDRWLVLVAQAFGKVVALPEVTLDWRLHRTNTSATWLPSNFLEAFLSIFVNPGAYRREFASKVLKSQGIIRSFAERFAERLEPRDKASVDAFLSLQSMGFMERRLALLKHRIFYTSLLRNLGLLALI
jgi:glycosyltransferase involved in cell wall biosynthesis